MIVEFFGPAGAGKTHLAHALSDRLNARGYKAEVRLSYQPGARVLRLDPGGFIEALHRITSGLIEVAAIAFRPIRNRRYFDLTARFIATLPLRRLTRLIRASQYILRLSRCWIVSSQADDIIIFDEAFVQVACSLALFSRRVGYGALSEVLALAPKSDVIVRLDAPPDLLEQRLRDRLKKESLLERVFEAKIKKNLEAIPIFIRVDAWFREHAQPTLQLTSHNLETLRTSLDRVEEAVLAKLNSRRLAHGGDGDVADRGAKSASYRTSHSSSGYARQYDRTFSEGYYAIEWEQVERPLVKQVLACLAAQGAKRSLDFACGTGRILEVHVETFEDVVGVDISAEMLSHAHQSCPEALLVEADLTVTGVIDEVRDVQVCTAFRFFLNAEPQLRLDALKALHSCIVEGGYLVANFHLNPTSLIGVFYRIRNRLSGRTINNLMSLKEAKALLCAHGFEVEATHWYGLWPRFGWRCNALNHLLQSRIERIGMRIPFLRKHAQTFLIVARRREQAGEVA